MSHEVGHSTKQALEGDSSEWVEGDVAVDSRNDEGYERLIQSVRQSLVSLNKADRSSANPIEARIYSPPLVPHSSAHPQHPISPTHSSASSSSAITYVDYDEAAEEEASNRLSTSILNTSDQPRFPPFATEQPTHILDQSIAQRVSYTDVARRETIPSPFLAATDDPFPSTIPSLLPPPPRESGGAFGGLPPSSFAALPRYDITPAQASKRSPFRISQDSVSESMGERTTVSKTNGHRQRNEKGDDDMWLKMFLSADRRVKENRPIDEQRSRKRFEKSTSIDPETEHEDDNERFRRESYSSLRGAEFPYEEEGEDLVSPGRIGRRRNRRIDSSPLRSPSHSSPPESTSNRSSPVSSPSKKGKKGKKNGHERKSTSSRDERNVTTDSLMLMLPRRSKRIRRNTAMTEVEEEGEEGGNETEEEETDYDEPIDPISSSQFRKGSSQRKSSKTKKSKLPSETDMKLGDRKNLTKWKEVDEYALETEYTL